MGQCWSEKRPSSCSTSTGDDFVSFPSHSLPFDSFYFFILFFFLPVCSLLNLVPGPLKQLVVVSLLGRED